MVSVRTLSTPQHHKNIKNMKYQTIALAGIFALGLSLASCSGSSKGEGSVAASEAAAVSNVAAEALAVDSTASALSWKGFKPGGEHYGKLPISAGQLDIKDDVLHGGYVTIKMDGKKKLGFVLLPEA